MDNNLNIPVPRIPVPPPPLEEMLTTLLKTDNLDRISIPNPLNPSNIPDTEEARNAIYALNRIRETLTNPFNSPETIWDRETWLRFVLEIVASIHEGLINAQTFASNNSVPHDPFEDLSAGEVGVISPIKNIFDGLDDFFFTENDTTIRTYCYRCVSSECLKVDPNIEKTIESIRLSNALDIRALRETLLNQAVRELYDEMEKWTNETRLTLLNQMVNDIINDKTSTEDRAAQVFTLDPRVENWLKVEQSNLRNYAISHMTDSAVKDAIDPRCNEIMNNLITERKMRVESEKTRLLSEADAEILAFKNELKVRNENEKSRLEEQAIANLRKQTNALNSPKRKTIETTKKQGKKKRTVLNLDTPTTSPISLSPLPTSPTSSQPLILQSIPSSIPEERDTMAPSSPTPNYPFITSTKPSDSSAPPANITQILNKPPTAPSDPNAALMAAIAALGSDLKQQMNSLSLRMDSIESKPSDNGYSTWTPDPKSHFGPIPEDEYMLDPDYVHTHIPTKKDYDILQEREMMHIYDEREDEFQIFSALYNKLVEKKGFPRQDNNFSTEEMEHRMRKIFINHKWNIRFDIPDHDFELLAKEYLHFRNVTFDPNPDVRTITPLPSQIFPTIDSPPKSTTSNIPPQYIRPSPPAPLSPTNPILSETWTTVTKKKPVTYAKVTKAKGNVGKDKPNNLVQTTLPTTTSTSSAASKPKPKPKRPIPEELKTTNYVIILDHSTPQTTLYRTDQTTYTIRLQEALKRSHASIRLLTGRWSNPTTIRRNFILCFEGKLSYTDISKYNNILFEPFGGSVCRGVPSSGYASVIFNNVPCPRTNGLSHSPSTLLREILSTRVCQGRLSLSQPRWLVEPSRLPFNKVSSSVVWAFYDPDGTGLDLMIRKPPALFGQQTSAKKFIPNPPFAQCDRCHRLGHTIERCRRDPKLQVCWKCGGPHSDAAHATSCPMEKHKHLGQRCNCPPYCFLCKEAKNRKHDSHDSRSASCPLRSSFRAPLPVLEIPPISAPVANIDPIGSSTILKPVQRRIPFFYHDLPVEEHENWIKKNTESMGSNFEIERYPDHFVVVTRSATNSPKDTSSFNA